MKISSPNRLRARSLVLGALLSLGAGWSARAEAWAQGDGSPAAVLLGRARTLEERGRLDLAKQDWAQVLLLEPKNAEALAGLVRASRADGHTAEAATYLSRLRAVNPKDPVIARVEGGVAPGPDSAAQLNEAARLARAGEPSRAMAVYRGLYGSNPPAGETALVYYETEATTAEGRPHAIAGLRALADRFPQQSRYQIALGKALTTNPRTRAEGRKLLERFPGDPQAVNALRQVVASGSSVPASGAESRSETAGRLQAAAANSGAVMEAKVHRAPSPTGEQIEARAAERARTADEEAAYAALSAGRLLEAEQRFKILLARDPGDSRASAGLAQVRASKPSFTTAGMGQTVGAASPAGPKASFATVSGGRRSGIEGAPVRGSKPVLPGQTGGVFAPRMPGAMSAKTVGNEKASADVPPVRVMKPAAAVAASATRAAAAPHGPARGSKRVASAAAVIPPAVDGEFEATAGRGADALRRGDLPGAEGSFRAALARRPDDPVALGGLGQALLEEQQNDAAASVYLRYTQARPTDAAGWVGLLTAQADGDRFEEVLATEEEVPMAARQELARDPDFFRVVGEAAVALGHRAEAERLFGFGLDLPFPPAGRGMSADAQVRYANLLSAAGHEPQAVGLFRQIVAADPNQTSAWIGLVKTEHAMGRETEALSIIGRIPSGQYAAGFAEPDFVATVAAVNEGEKHPEVAQALLESCLTRQRLGNQVPYAPAQVQLAGLYLRRGDAVRAYALYREALAQSPNSAQAWAGFIGALHGAGHDADAMAQLAQIPASALENLNHDFWYLEGVGGLYEAQGKPEAASFFLAREQAEYLARGAEPPAAFEIKTAQLLLESEDDADLDRVLLYLGGRKDLTDGQRGAVQLLWVRWAMRRADAQAGGGDERGAVATLNAATAAFSANPEAVPMLADGYASAGLPTQAVAMYRTQDMSKASPAVYSAAISAALAAADRKQAESWLHDALARYPGDSSLQLLAGRAEQARGHAKRAAEYYRAALQVAPAANPGAMLAAELEQPEPQGKAHGSHEGVSFVPPLIGALQPMKPVPSPAPAHPYLPSYADVPKGVSLSDVSKPPLLNVGPCAGWAGCSGEVETTSLPQTPATLPVTASGSASAHIPTLRDYVP